jgi:hypothetical protein
MQLLYSKGKNKMSGSTFWSDTMTLLLTDKIPNDSHIELPHGIAFGLAAVLTSNGYTITSFNITSRSVTFQSRCEIFIEVGADKNLESLIENSLTSKDITLTNTLLLMTPIILIQTTI